MRKRLRLICIAVLIAVIFIVCMIWVCRKKDTGSIPTLEEVTRMSDEEATSCLAGHSKKELVAAWGNPTMCLSGLPGDWWNWGEYGGRVTVYYEFGYYGDPDDISVTVVRISPDVYESEGEEAGLQPEDELITTEGEESGAERDRGVYSMRDTDIQEIPLYDSFLNNEVAAVDAENQEEQYWSDYYDKYSDLYIEAFHMKTVDVNGDGEKELLIHLRQGDVQGKILVFHNQNGSLVEWESISYGMHSREVNLYNNQIIEIVGHGWSRSFFTYNDKGQLERVFKCYSETDGDSYRQYFIQEYQNGVVTNVYSMMEIQGSNGGNDREVSEDSEKEAEFNRVLDDFLNRLGEGTRLNALFLVGFGEYSDYNHILDEVREEGKYGYYDVNGDGIDELVSQTVGGRIKIFCYQNNGIKELCDIPYSILLEDGTVWFYRPGGAPLHDDYQWFCLEGDVLIQPYFDSERAVLHNEGRIMREE